MKKFLTIYNKLISESKFKSKKWFYTGTSKGIAIFENVEHLSDWLKLRYEIEYKEWEKWTLIKKIIIASYIEKDLWSKCSKKDPYQRGFTIHLTISNMWLSGIIQNDLEDDEKRIYFSTFLPEKPKFNKHDIKLDIDL